MSLNTTPAANRFTIGIYGKRNAGKSSLINAVTAQEIALTSPVAGTTTDPVFKTIEILPIGPVVLIDTAGLDDTGELGEKRVEKSYEALRKCHMVILVLDGSAAGSDDAAGVYGEAEERFVRELRKRKITCVIALNKAGTGEAEVFEAMCKAIAEKSELPVVITDAVTGYGIEELKQTVIRNARIEDEIGLTDGLIEAGDVAVLVTPIDSVAPKGRLILPQQQVLRDILDKDAMAIVTKETDLPKAFAALGQAPKIVITDSQAFRKVSQDVPDEIPLTSFSILFARQKGDLEKQIAGIRALKQLQPGDRILIAEGCTHHRQCEDIGTVKIPKMIENMCPGVEYEWSSGAVFPKDIRRYRMIVHCGACMIGRREMQYRIASADEQDVPITNYGLLIAYATGILERAIRPLGLKL
ncbi:MAG: [Mogibacterium sp.]|nr:[FeFe] hydrogenase H-cluster maturation GTPase HydF [Mogibacterium sp.]